ncbi:PQQ-binding-like beta-propeller repeat protein [Streptomyces sp. NPDC060194]|uniref:outer membrane protein assembly factor BamB family protein n=1 Tax=Streptomyces sp. NPDC060194 TaxID=3347069 RepID=UPI00366962DC
MSAREARGPLTTLAVLLAAIGSVAAFFLSVEGYLPWDAMVRSWAAAEDREAEVTGGDATWVVGDVAVRSRHDAVSGYALTGDDKGGKLWEYVPPGRDTVCDSAEHAGAKAVLVALSSGGGSDDADGGSGACSTVLALDAESGRQLWKREWEPAKDPLSDATDLSALDLDARGDLAVVAEDPFEGYPQDGTQERAAKKDGAYALRALDLRTGAPRWTAELPDRCAPDEVSAGEKRVVAVLSCDAGGRDRREVSELTVAVLDRATGAVEWNVPVDARRPLDPATSVVIDATDPLVLAVGSSDEAEGASGLFASFDDDGRPRPTIDFDQGDDGIIGADSLMQTVVAGDRLYALAGYWEKGEHHTVIAFDLRTGDRVWSEEMDDPAAAMTVSGDRLTVLCEWSTQSDDITTLIELDARDGDETDERHFRDPVPRPVSAMYEADGLLVTAGRGGGAPFTAWERW